MYIKRNIRKRNIGNTVATTKTAVSPAPRTISSRGLGKYKFPICDEVPAGPYFSKIANAEFTTTKKGEPAIMVMYDIEDGYACWKKANGAIPEDAPISKYHIKQIYPENTEYYEDFADSMTEALKLEYGEEFLPEDIKGITEYVKIAYNSPNSDLGGIDGRCPMSREEFTSIGINTFDDDDE